MMKADDLLISAKGLGLRTLGQFSSHSNSAPAI